MIWNNCGDPLFPLSLSCLFWRMNDISQWFDIYFVRALFFIHWNIWIGWRYQCEEFKREVNSQKKIVKYSLWFMINVSDEISLTGHINSEINCEIFRIIENWTRETWTRDGWQTVEQKQSELILFIIKFGLFFACRRKFSLFRSNEYQSGSYFFLVSSAFRIFPNALAKWMLN